MNKENFDPNILGEKIVMVLKTVLPTGLPVNVSLSTICYGCTKSFTDRPTRKHVSINHLLWLYKQFYQQAYP